MAEQREFPALRRRLRELQRLISDVEENMAPGSLEASVGSTTVYLLGQYNQEANELEYILRWHQRTTNGALGRMQWMLVLASVAISSALLVLLVAQRWLP